MVMMSGHKMFHNFTENHHKIIIKTPKCSVDTAQVIGINVPIKALYATVSKLSMSQLVSW